MDVNNMGKYIIANTVEGKIKLEQMGFDLIMEQKVGQEMHYVFKNVDKYLNFSDEEKKEYITTNKIYKWI